MYNAPLNGFFGLGLIKRDESVWYPSLINFVICRQQYVEQEDEFAGGEVDNPDIANADAVSSVLGRRRHWRSWHPKRDSSFLDQKMFTIDFIF